MALGLRKIPRTWAVRASQRDRCHGSKINAPGPERSTQHHQLEMTGSSELETQNSILADDFGQCTANNITCRTTNHNSSDLDRLQSIVPLGLLSLPSTFSRSRVLVPRPVCRGTGLILGRRLLSFHGVARRSHHQDVAFQKPSGHRILLPVLRIVHNARAWSTAAGACPFYGTNHPGGTGPLGPPLLSSALGGKKMHRSAFPTCVSHVRICMICVGRCQR